MKVDISSWSHVETSFAVQQQDVVVLPSTPTNNHDVADDDDDNVGINKVTKSSKKKSLRKGQVTSLPPIPTDTKETDTETAASSSARLLSLLHHDGISFGFIEHTK